jgi:hypothetical protein
MRVVDAVPDPHALDMGNRIEDQNVRVRPRTYNDAKFSPLHSVIILASVPRVRATAATRAHAQRSFESLVEFR